MQEVDTAANTLYQRQDYASALELFTEAITNISQATDITEENIAMLYCQRSLVLYRQAQYSRSLKDAEKAIESDPTCCTGYVRAAEAMYAMGKYTDAVKFLTEAKESMQPAPDLSERLAMCNVEVEHQDLTVLHKVRQQYREGLGSSMAADGPRVSALVKQVEESLTGEEDAPGVHLDDLLKDLEVEVRQSVASQVQFAVSRGYQVVMLALTSGHVELAKHVLMSAAQCQMFQKHCSNQGERVRLPAHVISRLGSLIKMEHHSSPIRLAALQLLCAASRDRQLRGTTLVNLGLEPLDVLEVPLIPRRRPAPAALSSSEEEVGGVDPGAPIPSLMKMTEDEPWLSSLTHEELKPLAGIIYSYADDDQGRALMYSCCKTTLKVLVRQLLNMKHEGTNSGSTWGNTRGGRASGGGPRVVPRPLCKPRWSSEGALGTKEGTPQDQGAPALSSLSWSPIREVSTSLPSCCVCSHHLLEAALHCAANGGMLNLEALERVTGRDGRIKKVPSDLISGVVELVRKLQGSCPHCTQPDLGWDGKIKGYIQRQCAGDPCGGPEQPGAGGCTLIEGSLRLLLLLAGVGTTAAKELYRCNVTGVLDKLRCMSTPSILKKVAQIYGMLAKHNKAVLQEILEDGNIHGLVGILMQYEAHQVPKALAKVSVVLDSLSGQDYLWFITKEGGLALVFNMLMAPASKDTGSGPMCQDLVACQQVFLTCVDRSRRMCGFPPGSHRFPRGGFWDTVAPHQLLQVETWCAGKQERRGSGAQGPIVDDPHSADPSSNLLQDSSDRPDLVPSDLAPGGPVSSEHETSTSKASTTSGSRGTPGIGKDKDEDGLRVVWDSGPREEVRAHREAWKAMSLRDKISWSQTSTDITVDVKLPRGTSKRGMVVDVQPDRLTVRLDWYGRVVDGPLCRRVKAGEVCWVLEDEGATLNIIMPKDDSHYWKSLFQGGEERSYMELLQEAVYADEPVVGYDELDPSAKLLLENIRERQQEIAEGSYDLEKSFDDFRVVIGESGL